MRNHHYDRSQRRRREVPSACLWDLPDDAESGACPLWRVVDDGAVVDAISTLPPRLRSAYVLFADGSSYVTIAKSLDIPENTVGTRIRRARWRLRAVLKSQATATTSPLMLRARQLVENQVAS